jgi:hypothetical protein
VRESCGFMLHAGKVPVGIMERGQKP